jgi:hypothetical protein
MERRESDAFQVVTITNLVSVSLLWVDFERFRGMVRPPSRLRLQKLGGRVRQWEK